MPAARRSFPAVLSHQPATHESGYVRTWAAAEPALPGRWLRPLEGEAPQALRGCFILALVDAQGVALLPDAERAVRHVHVGDAQVREGVDHGVAEAGDAAHVRRFGNALGADRMMRAGRNRVV